MDQRRCRIPVQFGGLQPGQRSFQAHRLPAIRRAATRFVRGPQSAQAPSPRRGVQGHAKAPVARGGNRRDSAERPRYPLCQGGGALAPRWPPSRGTTPEPSSATARTGGSAALSLQDGGEGADQDRRRADPDDRPAGGEQRTHRSADILKRRRVVPAVAMSARISAPGSTAARSRRPRLPARPASAPGSRPPPVSSAAV